MSNLSHTAQSVLDAYSTEADRLDREVSDREMLAAALRAAADQVAPVTTEHTWLFSSMQVNKKVDPIRTALLAIAAELEGQ